MEAFTANYSEECEYSAIKEISSQATYEVQTFTRILADTIVIAYNISNEDYLLLSSNPHLQRDNIFNFIVSHLFRNSNIHDVLLAIFRTQHRAQEKELISACRKLQDLPIDRFNIDDKLCLNERTLQAFEEEITVYKAIKEKSIADIVIDFSSQNDSEDKITPQRKREPSTIGSQQLHLPQQNKLKTSRETDPLHL